MANSSTVTLEPPALSEEGAVAPTPRSLLVKQITSGKDIEDKNQAITKTLPSDSSENLRQEEKDANLDDIQRRINKIGTDLAKVREDAVRVTDITTNITDQRGSPPQIRPNLSLFRHILSIQDDLELLKRDYRQKVGGYPQHPLPSKRPANVFERLLSPSKSHARAQKYPRGASAIRDSNRINSYLDLLIADYHLRHRRYERHEVAYGYTGRELVKLAVWVFVAYFVLINVLFHILDI